MSINSMGGYNAISYQPAFTGAAQEGNSSKLKLKKTATTIGLIGAGIATIYAYKTGKKAGNTGLKALTSGFKTLWQSLKGKISGLFNKGNKEASNIDKAAKDLANFRVPQNYNKLVQNYTDEVTKVVTEASKGATSTTSVLNKSKQALDIAATTGVAPTKYAMPAIQTSRVNIFA